MYKKTTMFLASLMLMGTLFSSAASAQFSDREYEVTVTNISSGAYFTPILAVTHGTDVAMFELGTQASEELEALAENGMTGPLEDAIWASSNNVIDSNTSEGLLGPGETTTLLVRGKAFKKLSLAAMMLPTHDSFVALDSVTLPVHYSEVLAIAYDAGTEANDERCENIPGPQCGGANINDDSGEGFVHVSDGIHGVGDLDPAAYDWKNPVAQVTIKRTR